MPTETILTQASPQELAAAVEENLFALFRAMASLPEGQLVEGERLSYHLAFPTNPMFKGVWRARLPEDEIERSIDETVAWFEQRQAPFLFCWTGPSTQPSDLGERLERRGFANPEGRV
jgi:hypothetical protein